MTGVKMVHVPYRGASPAFVDIIAGHIEIYFGAMVSTLPHVNGTVSRPIEHGSCLSRHDEHISQGVQGA